jgi:hypothetical protein
MIKDENVNEIPEYIDSRIRNLDTLAQGALLHKFGQSKFLPMIRYLFRLVGEGNDWAIFALQKVNYESSFPVVAEILDPAPGFEATLEQKKAAMRILNRYGGCGHQSLLNIIKTSENEEREYAIHLLHYWSALKDFTYEDFLKIETFQQPE